MRDGLGGWDRIAEWGGSIVEHVPSGAWEIGHLINSL